MEEIFEDGEVIISKAGKLLLLFGEDMSHELKLELLLTKVMEDEEELVEVIIRPPLMTSFVGGRNESDKDDESRCF